MAVVTHLSAQCRKPYYQLNRINIISNNNKLRLLGLHKRCDVVNAVLDNNWLLSLVDLLAGCHLLGCKSESLLLLYLCFFISVYYYIWYKFVNAIWTFTCVHYDFTSSGCNTNSLNP